MHFTERECAPQTLSSPAAPNHDNLPPGRKTHIHTPPPSAGRTGGVLTYLTKSPVAGLSIRCPSPSKREPWQGQSHECSVLFHLSAHPIWGQRGVEIVRRFTAAPRALTANCGLSMLLEGEYTAAYGFSSPLTRPASSMALTMEEVMPHLLKPVAT